MRGKPLTTTMYVGGKEVESLTEEQIEKMAQKLSETMSVYYTAHPEEFRKIKSN